jgi:glycosyltransferase involved in cell wall biosynthesis
LASVRAQTRADFECIVCLNGRYDREGYAEALAPFLADSRFRAVEISAAGIGEACQAGLEATDAEYLAILDDDDEYLPEYLARLTGLLDADPTLAVAFGTVAEYRGGERVYQTRHLDPYGRPATGWSHADMWARNWIPCIGGVFRGEILRAGGGFDPSAGGNTDMDVWLRCTSVGGAVELPEVLAVRHLHGSNTSGDYNRQGDPRMVDWHNRIREKQRAGCYWRWSGDRPDDEPLPSLPRMAANLAGAALDHMLNGLKMADEATRKSRLAICRQCPHYRGDGRCSLCGCGLDAKVSWAASRCPDYPPRW